MCGVHTLYATGVHIEKMQGDQSISYQPNIF